MACSKSAISSESCDSILGRMRGGGYDIEALGCRMLEVLYAEDNGKISSCSSVIATMNMQAKDVSSGDSSHSQAC